MNGLIRNLTKDKEENKNEEDSDNNKMILQEKPKSNVIKIETQVLCEGNMLKRSFFL